MRHDRTHGVENAEKVEFEYTHFSIKLLTDELLTNKDKFFICRENSNKKEATISSIIQNIVSTLESFTNVFIIVLIFICNKLLKLLLNIKCKLTEKYADIHILNIRAIINKILLLIFILLFFSIH